MWLHDGIHDCTVPGDSDAYDATTPGLQRTDNAELPFRSRA
jgi:hypothetical protein